MKRIILVCFLAFSFYSCSPIYLVDKTEFKTIPKGAKKIIVTTGLKSDSLFNIVSKSLSRDGWIVSSNPGAMQISAQNKSVGSGTTLTPVIYIEGGVAYYSGEWGLDQQGQLMMSSFGGASQLKGQPIKFEKSGITKNDVAFQGLLQLAKKVPEGKISYEL